MQQVTQGNQGGAMREAWKWREQNPADELALLALGEAAEASGDLEPRRPRLRLAHRPVPRPRRHPSHGRRAPRGSRPAGLQLAVDTFAQAVAQRPDHPSSHRLYAFALLKAGRHADAFAAALVGARQSYPWGRFAGVPRILEEDLRLIAAAWLAARPPGREDHPRRAGRRQRRPRHQPLAALRPQLGDRRQRRRLPHLRRPRRPRLLQQPQLASGGELYADVTTGYGPECFTIPGIAAAFPYTLQGHYYSRGPMGYGMGKLEVIEHDGAGHLRFKEHPFVIMKDGAFVDLGRLDGPAGEEQRRPAPGHPAKGQTPAKTPSGGTYTPPPPVAPATLPPTRF
jgi:hypothetical protein